MRWLAKLVFILVCLSGSACLAQSYTQVSATAVDAQGGVYANCTYNVSFVGQSTQPGPYLLQGSVFQQSYPGVRCDGFGKFTIRLPSNLAIQPRPSSWEFHVCDQSGHYCNTLGSVVLAISGSALDISGQLSPTLPILPGGGGGGGWSPPLAPGNTLFGNPTVGTTTPSFFIPGSPGDVSLSSGAFSVNALHFGPTIQLNLSPTGITNGNCLQVSGSNIVGGTCGTGGTPGGGGTVTNFSSPSGLSPLFTTSVATSTTTPVLSFAWTNAPANTMLANPTTTAAPPSWISIPGSLVTSFNTRQGAVVPAANDYNFSQIAGTLAASQLPSTGLVTAFNTRSGAVSPLTGDYTYSMITGAAPLANPIFTGNPQGPTPNLSDSSTSLATTAWVKQQNYGTATPGGGIASLSSGNLTGLFNVNVTSPSGPNASLGFTYVNTVPANTVLGNSTASTGTPSWIPLPTTTGAINPSSIGNVRIVNGVTYAKTAAGINAADAALGQGAGEIWITDNMTACDTQIRIADSHVLKIFRSLHICAPIVLGNYSRLTCSTNGNGLGADITGAMGRMADRNQRRGRILATGEGNLIADTDMTTMVEGRDKTNFTIETWYIDTCMFNGMYHNFSLGVIDMTGMNDRGWVESSVIYDYNSPHGALYAGIINVNAGGTNHSEIKDIWANPQTVAPCLFFETTNTEILTTTITMDGFECQNSFAPHPIEFRDLTPLGPGGLSVLNRAIWIKHSSVEGGQTQSAVYLNGVNGLHVEDFFCDGFTTNCIEIANNPNNFANSFTNIYAPITGTVNLVLDHLNNRSVPAGTNVGPGLAPWGNLVHYTQDNPNSVDFNETFFNNVRLTHLGDTVDLSHAPSNTVLGNTGGSSALPSWVPLSTLGGALNLTFPTTPPTTIPMGTPPPSIGQYLMYDGTHFVGSTPPLVAADTVRGTSASLAGGTQSGALPFWSGPHAIADSGLHDFQGRLSYDGLGGMLLAADPPDTSNDHTVATTAWVKRNAGGGGGGTGSPPALSEPAVCNNTTTTTLTFSNLTIAAGDTVIVAIAASVGTTFSATGFTTLDSFGGSGYGDLSLLATAAGGATAATSVSVTLSAAGGRGCLAVYKGGTGFGTPVRSNQANAASATIQVTTTQANSLVFAGVSALSNLSVTTGTKLAGTNLTPNADIAICDNPIPTPGNGSCVFGLNPAANRLALGVELKGTTSGGGGGLPGGGLSLNVTPGAGIIPTITSPTTLNHSDLVDDLTTLSYGGSGGMLVADPPPGSSDHRVATTAWVKANAGGGLPGGGAPLDSPIFIGTPQAPKPLIGDNSDRIPTTSWVHDVLAAALTAYAPIDSPTFTTAAHAPTPLQGSNDTSVATTAWVKEQGYGTGGGGGGTPVPLAPSPDQPGICLGSTANATSLNFPNLQIRDGDSVLVFVNVNQGGATFAITDNATGGSNSYTTVQAALSNVDLLATRPSQARAATQVNLALTGTAGSITACLSAWRGVTAYHQYLKPTTGTSLTSYSQHLTLSEANNIALFSLSQSAITASSVTVGTPRGAANGNATRALMCSNTSTAATQVTCTYTSPTAVNWFSQQIELVGGATTGGVIGVVAAPTFDATAVSSMTYTAGHILCDATTCPRGIYRVSINVLITSACDGGTINGHVGYADGVYAGPTIDGIAGMRDIGIMTDVRPFDMTTGPSYGSFRGQYGPFRSNGTQPIRAKWQGAACVDGNLGSGYLDYIVERLR